MASLCRLAAVAIAAAGAGACGSGAKEPSQQAPDYATHEPGSDVAPTSDASFQLLAADGPTRFAALQQLIVQAHHACSAVTKGVLTGGLDGTDEWRVDCADSGPWQVWFKPDSEPEVARCANEKCG